jgi:hypothetical protein
MRRSRAPDDEVVFHPPPGWPPEPPPGMPPRGWTIPPGWRPVPDLPPAPEGWQFWVPAGPRPPQAAGRSLSFYVKAAAAVITFFATVIGVAIAIQGRPAPYTLADWSAKANAVCEEDFPQQHIPMLQTLLALRGVMASHLRDQTESNQAVLGISSSADAFRKLVGNLRALPVPDGASAQINELLNRGENIFSYLTRAAADIQNGLNPPASTAAKVRFLRGAVSALAQVLTKAGPAWGQSVKSLNLGQCRTTY